MTAMAATRALPPIGALGDVSRETLARLALLEEMLHRWTARINLVAPSTLADAWLRHVVDSAQLLASPWPSAARWLDMGSGGGFPGLVIAILLHEADPAARVTLVESDRRKVAFLRQAALAAGVSVAIHAARIESLPPQGAHVVTARALAALDRLCALAAPHLAPDGQLRLLKGRTSEQEVAQARLSWSFDVQSLPSITDPQAAVLTLGNLRHV